MVQDKKLVIAQKAIIAAIQEAVIIRTTDGQQIVMSPSLSREIGEQLIGMSYLSNPPEPSIITNDWPTKGA